MIYVLLLLVYVAFVITMLVVGYRLIARHTDPRS